MNNPMPNKPNSAQCSGCGAGIYWIKTVAGKAMPVDTKLRIVMVPSGEFNDLGEETYAAVKGYKTHFASCPKAAAFRKSGEIKGGCE